MSADRKPGVFIPTLYFAEGLPYTIVMEMSGVFFKSLGADNIFIGLTSFLSLPWILKFAWSPLVDFYGTKRRWIIAAEFVLALLVLGMAAVAYLTGHTSFASMTTAAIVIMTGIAIASATQDVSVDAFYLDALAEDQKAFYVGIRNTAYRVARIFGTGAMVYMAGKLAESQGLHTSWGIAFAMCALAMLCCALFHSWYLPFLHLRRTGNGGQAAVASSAAEETALDAQPVEHNFFKAILTYFNQPGIVAIVTYILIFRLGDALMLKQAPNFLLDPVDKAGLGISVASIGIVQGTVGVLALLLGGIIASWLISKDGLKRWMWPLTLIQSFAILFYWALAQWPSTFAVHSPLFDNPYLPAVYVVNSIEQFAYGMGVSAYTVFLLTTVRSEYKAAHYATATALMALGVLVPGAVSGYIYQAVGYATFFLISFFASLPGIVAIFFLPMWRESDNKPRVGNGGGQEVGVSQAGQVGSQSK